MEKVLKSERFRNKKILRERRDTQGALKKGRKIFLGEKGQFLYQKIRLEKGKVKKVIRALETYFLARKLRSRGSVRLAEEKHYILCTKSFFSRKFWT